MIMRSLIPLSLVLLAISAAVGKDVNLEKVPVAHEKEPTTEKAADPVAAAEQLVDAADGGVSGAQFQEILANEFQVGLAVTALAVGATMIVNGDLGFQLFCTVGVTGYTYFFMLQSIEALLNFHFPNGFLKMFASAEFALLAGMAAFRGFNGLKIVAGAGVGAYVAYFGFLCAAKGAAGDAAVEEQLSQNLFVGANVMALLGVYFMIGGGYKGFATYLCAFIGGCLTSAALGYLVVLACIHTHQGPPDAKLGNWPAPFAKFVAMLTHPNAEDVGVFAGTHTAEKILGQGTTLTMDKILGYTAWICCFFFSINVQSGDDKY